MKKKLLVLGMILTLLTGTVTVTAAQIPVVRLNDAEEFEYYSDEKGTKIDSLSLNEFTGMAPGMREHRPFVWRMTAKIL